MALVVGMAGCTIVEDAPEGEQAIAADASGDDARTEMRIEDTFESELIPHIRDNAKTDRRIAADAGRRGSTRRGPSSAIRARGRVPHGISR